MKMAIHRSSSWTRCGRAGVANVYLLLTAAGTAAAMLCYLFLLSPPRSSVREDTPVITLHRVNYSSSFSSPWMNNLMMRLGSSSSSSSGSTDNNPPATATKGSSSSNYSVGMEKIYDELDIDDKRKALRLTQRFNLLEEEEEEATTATGHHQVNECTVQYANDNRLQQNHPCVIQLIRRHFLQPPAPKESLLNLKFPNHTNPSAGQSQAILQYLRNQVRTSSSFLSILASISLASYCLMLMLMLKCYLRCTTRRTASSLSAARTTARRFQTLCTWSGSSTGRVSWWRRTIPVTANCWPRRGSRGHCPSVSVFNRIPHRYCTVLMYCTASKVSVRL